MFFFQQIFQPPMLFGYSIEKFGDKGQHYPNQRIAFGVPDRIRFAFDGAKLWKLFLKKFQRVTVGSNNHFVTFTHQSSDYRLTARSVAKSPIQRADEDFTYRITITAPYPPKGGILLYSQIFTHFVRFSLSHYSQIYETVLVSHSLNSPLRG